MRRFLYIIWAFTIRASKGNQEKSDQALILLGSLHIWKGDITIIILGDWVYYILWMVSKKLDGCLSNCFMLSNGMDSENVTVDYEERYIKAL